MNDFEQDLENFRHENSSLEQPRGSSFTQDLAEMRSNKDNYQALPQEAQLGGLSFEDDLVELRRKEGYQPIQQETQPQSEEGETELHRALRELGTPDWLNNYVLEPYIRTSGNLVSGAGDTFIRGWMNVPALAMRALGAGSEALLGGESIFTQGANWINDADAQYVALSNAYRHGLTGDNPTYWDNVIHGTGTSLGYIAYGLTAKKIAQALGAGATAANIIRFITENVSEALTEAGNTTSELYAQDKTRGKDALMAGIYSLVPNALVDLGQGWAEGAIVTPFLDKYFFPNTKGFWKEVAREGAKVLLREELDENLQEPRQQLIEEAAKNTFKSGDMSLRSYGGNLGEEASKFGDYFMQTLPETAASTAITSLLTFGVGAEGAYTARKQEQEQIDSQNKAKYNNLVAGRDNLQNIIDAKKLKLERDNLQERINNAYENLSNSSNADEGATFEIARAADFANIAQMEQQLKELNTRFAGIKIDGIENIDDIDNFGDIPDLERKLKNLDNSIANFWGDTGVVSSQNQVQDDAGQTLFPDADEIIQSSSNLNPDIDSVQETTTAPVSDTPQSQNIPQIFDADTAPNTEDSIQNNEPDLLADIQNDNDISPMDMLYGNRNSQSNITDAQQNNLPEDFVDEIDDEPDADLEDDYSEQYNQLITSDNNQGYDNNDTTNNGEQNAGTFVFSAGIGGRAKDYSFNVVATFGKIREGLKGFIYRLFNQRLSRWNGRFLEIRNKRAKVVATYNPQFDSFSFSPDFDRNHSRRWKQKFERDFRAELNSYLNGGGFLDERGRLKPDGNEDFRRRWRQKINTDGFFGTFQSRELQPEDIDTPSLDTLSVSYQNSDGLEINEDLSVTPGSFPDSMPEQKMYYGSYLDIKDGYGYVIARYAPRTGRVSFVKGTDAGLKQAVAQQLRRKANSLMDKAGFLDENGNLIPDGNEYYRNARRAANDIPSSMLNTQQNINPEAQAQAQGVNQYGQQSTQGISPLGQQNNSITQQDNSTQIQNVQGANILGQQESSTPNQQVQQTKPKGKKAQLADAISDVGNKVDAALGNGNQGSQSETYNQATQDGETQQSWVDSAKNFITGLLGRSNDSTSTVTNTQGTQDNNPNGQQVKTLKVKGSNGQWHTLTVKRKNFSDKHKQAQQYHGSYLEATDENGRVVARWSPYSMQFQMANIQDADVLQPQILQSLKDNRTSLLQDFGYFDEYGRLKSEGNEKYRRKYRARQYTTPEGMAEHSDNLNTTQTKKRKDTRSWKQIWDDYKEERKRYEKTRRRVQARIRYQLRKIAEQSEAQSHELTKEDKQRIRQQTNTIAEAYSHVITARINAAAHLAGMSISDYHKLWKLRIGFDSKSDGNTKGYVNFKPAGYKIDEKTGKNVWHDAETIINLTRLSDTSTILHEFAHIFLRDYQDLIASVDDLPSKVKKDWLYLTRWLGISDIDPKSTKATRTDEENTRMQNAQEKFAVAFEQYYMTGKAPKSRLQRVFNYFKEWMTSVYGAIKNIRYQGSDGREHEVELSPEVKRIFGRMLKGSSYYIPSADSARARIERTNTPQHGEEFNRQSIGGQDKSIDENEQRKINRSKLNLNLPFNPDELRTETGSTIDEAHSSELLVTPNGSTALAYIDTDTASTAGIQEGEIQANVGILRHAEQRHGKQIKDAGYDNVQTFLLDTLNNWQEIRQGTGNSLWLVAPKYDGHGAVAALMLHQNKNGVYRVSTLLFARSKIIGKKGLLFAGRPSPTPSSGSGMNLARAESDFSPEVSAAKGGLSEEQLLKHSVTHDSDNVNSSDNGKSEIYRQSAGLVRTEDDFLNIKKQYDNANAAEAKRQYDAVVRTYRATPHWMKAPNGKKSNLTEKQWVIVRTPNFKRWFGDWENDPANASKVLDENGEPLVVYHGTPNGSFNTFRVTGEGGSSNTGAWFTENRNMAQTYTRNAPAARIYAVFLNIRNPYTLDAKNKGWNALAVIGRKAITTDHVVRGVFANIIGNGNHDGVIIRNVVDPYVPMDDYILRVPSNIKSATHNNGNFSRGFDEIYKQTATTERNNAQQVEANNLEWTLRISRKQLETVRRLYQGTDKWMKAPNGQSTNLTEKQWLQVRTPNFKRWFGDWEKHPENASKAVDRNGEPLVVYRGTFVGDTINADGSRSRVFRTKTYSGGSFYSSSEIFATSYAGVDNIKAGKSHVYSVFLNLRNPFIVDALYNAWTSIPFNGENYITDELAKKVRSGKIGDGIVYDSVIVKNVSDWGVETDGITDTNVLVRGEQLVIQAYDGLIEEGYRPEDITHEDIDRYIYENPNISNRAKRTYKQYLEQNFADDFIVFNSNAIKSATGNNGAFGTETGDIYKQVIGEAGARRLDEAEGSTIRMDNLALAKQMERQGIPIKKMWLATSWMRGAEGKWRYEIPDGKVIGRRKFNKRTFDEFQALQTKARIPISEEEQAIQEEIAEYQAVLLHTAKGTDISMDELVSRFNAWLKEKGYEEFVKEDPTENYDFSRLTDKERKRYEKLKKFYEDTTLQDVFDAPELFKAYPQLRRAPYFEADFSDKNSSGEYFNGLIRVDTNLSNSKLRSTLIHEIQHAIQKIEGFALGNDDEGGEIGRIEDTRNMFYEKAVDVLDSLTDKKSYDKVSFALEELDSGNPKRIAKAKELTTTFSEEEKSVYEEAKGYIEKALALNDEWINTTYAVTAGEIESRNTQTRRNWGDKRRRNTPLNESEDVPREKQLIRLDSNIAETYNQPLNNDVDLDRQISVLKISETMPNVPFYQRIKAFGKEKQQEIISRFSNGAVVNKHTGLTITLSKVGLNHILDTARNNDNIGGAVIYQAVPYLDSLAKNAYRVETHKDLKPSATKIEGQSGNLKQVHRFLVPVELNSDIHILKLTAKEYESGKAEIDEVSLYDMKYTKKMSAHPSQNSPNLMRQAAGTIGSTDSISVRDMLEGVNDVYGNPYSESYNQIISVDGARRLDEAEGVTTRMDNLKLAKRMVRNGIPAKKIWAATGWTRGAEGKWRYEIPDGKINRKKLEQLRKIANEFQALNDFYDNNPNHNDIQEEIDHYNALESSYYAKLSDVFDAPELFTAYPDLRDISVWIDNNLNAAAEYDSLTNSIIISGYNTNFSKKRELKKSIIHEIQHAVQVREGFALGSTYDNTDTLYKRYVNKVHSLWDKLGEKLQRKVKEILKAQDNSDIYRMQSWINALSDNEFALYNAWAEAVEKAKQRSDYLFSKYERHSGEVEARNSETRAYWSEKRRHNTPLDRSEDISREEQIIGRLPKKSTNTETYNQSIGYGAALRLDEKNGNHNLIDNLRVAQRMERRLKPNWAKIQYSTTSSEWVRDYTSARKIWNATGWYRGADGQWKFELPYGEINTTALEHIVQAYNRQIMKLLAYKPYATTLSSFFDAPELFKAYTNLKNLTVSFEQMDNDTLGYLSGSENKLAININIADDADKVREVLIHEIQHWIQDVEGFASGGNTKMAKYFADTNALHSQSRFNPTFFESKNYRREADHIIHSVSQEQQQIFHTLYEAQKNIFTDNFDEKAYTQALTALLDENKETFSLWSNLMTKADRKVYIPTTQSESYWRFAGEVEARNASYRATLSEHDRKANPPFDTQDIPSEQQFVFDSNANPFSRSTKEAVDYFRDTILKQLTDNPNETYNQVIGEKSAELIDRAIGAQWLTYNLDLAKKLKQLGFKPRSIRRVTGWELGHEGKWKFEVPDGSLKDNIRLEAVEPNLDPFNDNSIFSDIPFGFETKPFARTTLGNIFNSTELFAAYPQLKDITVTFVQGNDFEDNGIHYPSGSTAEDLSITLEGDFHFDGNHLYPNANDSTILTLLHEIQHAIQHIEGFAGGSNMDLAVRNSPAVKKFDRRIDALQKKLSTLYHNPNFTTDEEALFGNNPQSQEYYDLERKLYALIDEKERFIQNAMTDGTARNFYKRSAGETEARNVMTRHGMTEQQRRNTLLRDTEDFRHEELFNENGETYNQTANDNDRVAQHFDGLLTPEAQKQIDTLRAKYFGTDKWLKAPNGKNSNLNELQWLLVRTDNFKRWFGDWENDAQNASKVLDENGEPLVVFHGTTVPNIHTFKRSEKGWLGPAIYLTPYIAYANDYTKRGEHGTIMELFLNVHNPLVVKTTNPMMELLTILYGDRAEDVFNERYEKIRAREAKNFTEKLGKGQIKGAVDQNLDRVVKRYIISDEELQKILSQGNYDGISWYDPEELQELRAIADDGNIPLYNTEFAVLNPTQIKSASRNNGMFGVGVGDIYKQSVSQDNFDSTSIARSDKDLLTPRAKKQIAAVRVKYFGTPQWLKAPNGRDTNLNELQWLLVRTDNFKRWFGDWINDPQNSSKVLDENGEPLIVLHISRKGTGYSVFNTYGDFSLDGTKTKGTGAWFADFKGMEQEVSENTGHSIDTEGKNIYHVFLNLRNPYTYDAEGKRWQRVGKVWIEDKFGSPIYHNLDGKAFSNLSWAKNFIRDRLGNNTERYTVKHSDFQTTDELVRSVRLGTVGNGNHDGVIIRNLRDMSVWGVDDYVAFEPTQIKSATRNNGEYSLSNDEIYKQQSLNDQQDRQLINNARNLADHFGLFGDNTAERYLQHFGLEPTDEYSPELRALLEHNKRAEPAFRSLMDNLHRELGGKLILRKQMKSPERIIIKANRLFGGNISKVGDVWAGTLAFDTEDELLNAFSKLRQRNDLITIRNRWTKPKVSTGYRDIISYFRLNNGTVVELQLQMKDVQDVKDNAGHFLYEFISNNQDDYELHDLVWDTGDLSKRLYSAAVDGTYKALSDTDKNILRSLAQSLANSHNFDEAQEAIDDISDFLDKVLPEHKNSDRETQIAVQHNTDRVSSIYIQENEHSIIVPISELHFTKRVTYRSVQKARSNMERAIHGNIPKREPLKVRLRHDGGYNIIDGNNTYAVLKELGAKFVPVEVLGSPYSSERHSNASFREQRSQLSVSNAAVSSSTSINEPSGDNKYTRPDGIKSSGMCSSPARYSTANGAPSTLTKYSNILNSSNPDIINPDNLIMGSETYYQIGAKRKHDMDTALARHRPDMTPQQRAEAITEIEKLGESVRQGGNPKVEKIATHWLLGGHIILPEDNYKILDAIRISEQQHFDPMSFDDPNEILAKYTIRETKTEKRINPDNVPEFTNKVTYDNGITVYTVDDTEDGQLAVRSIIDTHWGEDANPWCLAARTENLNFNEDEYEDEYEYEREPDLTQAWDYWSNTYNAVDKRIAFQNGKLLAFCASDNDINTWWDREDHAHEGIPYTVKENGNTFVYSYNETTGQSIKIKETLSDETIRTWSDNGTLKSETLSDGTQRDWYDNGLLKSETLSDGTRREWSDGTIFEGFETMPDSILRGHHKQGKIEQRPDGQKHGQLLFEHLPDDTEHRWNDKGQLLNEKLPDGTERRWYNNGHLWSEKLPNERVTREWYENGKIEQREDGIIHGQLKSEISYDGTARTWYESGRLHTEQLRDRKPFLGWIVREWYDNDNKNPKKEFLPNGTKREWFENGNQKSEEIPYKHYRYWFENGHLSSESLNDGTERAWYESGKLKSESIRDRHQNYTIREWYENGQIEQREDGEIHGQLKYEQVPYEPERYWDEHGNLTDEAGNLIPDKTSSREVHNQSTQDNKQDYSNSTSLLDKYSAVLKNSRPRKINPNNLLEGSEGFITPENIERYSQVDTYHGTGHIIKNNRFALQYVGTGEGMQQEGYGIYTAQARGVGEIYRRMGLSGTENFISITFNDGHSFSSNPEFYYMDIEKRWSSLPDSSKYQELLPFLEFDIIEAQFMANGSLPKFRQSVKNIINKYRKRYRILYSVWQDNFNGDFNDILAFARQEIGNPYDNSTFWHNAASEWKNKKSEAREKQKNIEAILEFLNSISDTQVFPNTKQGNIYRAAVADNYLRLNWDAALSQQSQHVKKAILKVKIFTRGLAKKISANTTELDNAITGEDLYKSIANIMNEYLARNTPADGITDPAQRTSLLFNRFGVPGLYYLDEFSRDDTTGTYNTCNYVTWNEDAMRITGIEPDSDQDAIDYFNNYKREHPDEFITPDALSQMERYDQLVTHATGNIIWNNRFDLRFVGSSEGTATYGFGAYFEQNPAVAKKYRRYGLPNYGLGIMNVTLKDGRILQIHNVKDIWDARYNGNAEPGIYSHILTEFMTFNNGNYVGETDFSFKQAKARLKEILSNELRQLKGQSSPKRNYYKNLLKQLRDIKDITFSNPLNGNIYQFNIPEDYELLNWDMDLSHQPEQVKKSIRKIINALQRHGYYKDRIPHYPTDIELEIGEYDRDRKPTGADLYNAVAEAFYNADKQGQDLFSLKRKGIARADAKASWLFNHYGIPGHRFLDRGSRDACEGTHNFVIWNMDRVTMTGISDDSDEFARKTFYNGGKQQLSLFDNNDNPANNGFMTQADIEQYKQLHTHATRHIILDNQFDLRYLHTGEGGNMFGAGIYLEENPDVAEVYRNIGISDKERIGTLHIQTVDGNEYVLTDYESVEWKNTNGKEIPTPLREALNRYADCLLARIRNKLNTSHADIQQDVIDYYRDAIKETKKKSKLKHDESSWLPVLHTLQNALDCVYTFNGFKQEGQKKGNVYHVSIPENYELMDWDNTLDNQPEKITHIINKIIDTLHNTPAEIAAFGYATFTENPQANQKELEHIISQLIPVFREFEDKHVDNHKYKSKNGGYAWIDFEHFKRLPQFKQLKNIIHDTKILEELHGTLLNLSDTDGNEARITTHWTGKNLYWTLAELTGSPLNASMYLNSLGIPGHRYWDKGSRDAKTGTHNFVIWNTSRLKIVGIEGDQEAVDYFRNTTLQKLTGNPNETYQQIIGTQGAKAIDKRHNNSWLMDNLDVAKAMTKAGETPFKIRLATGWELGTDGEWKYEIQDGNINITRDLRKILHGKGVKLPYSIKLKHLYNNAELFTAYPQLNDLRVEIVDDLPSGIFGFFEYHDDPAKRYIALSSDIPLHDLQSALIHEIQHAVQSIEGFAEGGEDRNVIISGQAARAIAVQQIKSLLPNASKELIRAAEL